MLYEEWKSRYKNLKNFNTVLQRCPRFWPLAPPRGMNPGVYSLGISEDPPRYLSSKFDASVRSDCWDISIWKTLTQCDGNGNANADDRGDYNSSPCTSYRRAKICITVQSPLFFFLCTLLYFICISGPMEKQLWRVWSVSSLFTAYIFHYTSRCFFFFFFFQFLGYLLVHVLNFFFLMELYFKKGKYFCLSTPRNIHRLATAKQIIQ